MSKKMDIWMQSGQQTDTNPKYNSLHQDLLIFQSCSGSDHTCCKFSGTDQPDVIQAPDVGKKCFSQMRQLLVMELLSDDVTTFGKNKIP